MDVSPLGAGALAGSSLPLDPDGVAEDLGFGSRFENSLDAVSDRDFVAEALFDLALLGVHLSRLGEEFVLWSSEEFGFLVLDDAYATGSSMLPQKKNPDVAELARAKAGRLIGHVAGMLATLKGLPLAYNRDLQEDKEPLFDAFDQIKRALPAVMGMLGTAHFDTEKMRAAADGPAAAAVDLAEWLVEQGHALPPGARRGGVARARLGAARRAAGRARPGQPPSRDRRPGPARAGRGGDASDLAGGAGPKPVAVQVERFRHRLDLDRQRVSHAAAAAHVVGGADDGRPARG